MKYEYFSVTRCPECGKSTPQLHSSMGYGRGGRTEYTRCSFCPNVYESKPNCYEMRSFKDEEEYYMFTHHVEIPSQNEFTVSELKAELRKRKLAELTTEELIRRLNELE